MRQIIVDAERCQNVADIINGLRFLHPEGYRPKTLGREKDLFFLYIMVGVCHQINWNFLMAALEKIKALYPEKFTLEYMQGLTHGELLQWLSGYPKLERLSPQFRRAEFIRGMCRLLLEKYGGSVATLLQNAQGKIGGENGLYSLLAECEAYGEDPLKKKATLFVELVDRWGLGEFSDWENYIPPIDYHICRIAIRSGLLVVQDNKLLSWLQNQTPVSEAEDLAIRSAAIEAIIEVSQRTEQSTPKDIQALLWAVARDCCHEEELKCEECSLADCSVRNYIPKMNCGGRCLFRSVCCAANDEPALRLIREQNFVTTWY